MRNSQVGVRNFSPHLRPLRKRRSRLGLVVRVLLSGARAKLGLGSDVLEHVGIWHVVACLTLLIGSTFSEGNQLLRKLELLARSAILDGLTAGLQEVDRRASRLYKKVS